MKRAGVEGQWNGRTGAGVKSAARVSRPVPIIRFEAADTAELTAVGEGITRPAREAGRLRTGTDVGKYAVFHGDGCAVCGRSVDAGDPFYLDSGAGEVLCAEHGRERRGD